MKTMKRILVLITGVALASVALHADEDNMNYNELPEAARVFLEKHFGKNPMAKEIEHEHSRFSVELRNGYEMEFDSAGKLLEVDSPDRNNLTQGILNDVLPAKAVNHLREKGVLKQVDDVKILRNGDYLVGIDKMVNDYTIRFDNNGELSKLK